MWAGQDRVFIYPCPVLSRYMSGHVPQLSRFVPIKMREKENRKLIKIIALDMATVTGWAVNGQSGTFKADLKRGESPGMRFLRFRSWLRSLIQTIGGVDLLVFEQAHHRGGAATQLCVGLMTEALTAAAEHGANTMPVHSGTLKKWACGHGKAEKKAMIERARQFGFDPVDDNEADACLLFRYAVQELGLGGGEGQYMVQEK
jgi:hypothetical protein